MAKQDNNNEGQGKQVRRGLTVAAVAAVVAVGGAAAANGAADADFDATPFMNDSLGSGAGSNSQMAYDVTDSQVDKQANRSDNGEDDEGVNDTPTEATIDDGSGSTAYNVTEGEGQGTIATPGSGDGGGGNASTPNAPVVSPGENGNGGGGNNNENGDDVNTRSDGQTRPKITDTKGDLTDVSVSHVDADGNTVLSFSVEGEFSRNLTAGEKLSASVFEGVTATAEVVTPKGEQKTVTVPYSSYEVVLSTKSSGTYRALFSYCGYSDTLSYTIVDNHATIKPITYLENTYYAITVPDESIAKALPTSGTNSIDPTAIIKRVIAWIAAGAEGAKDNERESLIQLDEDGDGYLELLVDGITASFSATTGPSDELLPIPFEPVSVDTTGAMSTYLHYIDVPSGMNVEFEKDATGDYTGGTVLTAVTAEAAEGGTLSVPQGVTNIELSGSCEGVTKLVIPQGVESIDIAALLEYLPDLTEIEVAQTNTSYASANGLLLSADGTQILAIPPSATEMTIPESVTSFADDAAAYRPAQARLTVHVTCDEPHDTHFNRLMSLAGTYTGGVYFELGQATTEAAAKLFMASWGPTLEATYGAGTAAKHLYVAGNEQLTASWAVASDGSVVLATDAATLVAAPWQVSGSYTIAQGTTTVLEGALASAGTLKTLVVPASVTSLAANSLECSTLVLVQMKGAAPPTLGTCVFGLSLPSDLSIEVPANAQAVYLPAWESSLDAAYGTGTAAKLLTEESSLVFQGEGLYRSLGNDEYELVMASPTGTSFEFADGIVSIAEGAFAGCTGLTELNVPTGVTSIGSGAFKGCTSLQVVCFPKTLTSLACNALTGCTALDAVAFNTTKVPYTGKLKLSAQATKVYVPAKAKAVYKVGSAGSVSGAGTSYSFKKGALCATSSGAVKVLRASTGFTGTYAVPSATTRIETKAFYGCTGLEGVDFSAASKLSYIGAQAFEGCTALIAVDTSQLSKLTTLGKRAFAKCASLTEIILPSSLKTAASGWFRGCTSLVAAQLPTSLASVPSYCFHGCSSLTGITTTSAVKSVGAYAFAGCESLQNVSLAASKKLTSVGEYAFSGCTGLSTIVLPGSVKKIGAYAFANCTNLPSASLPKSLTAIDEGLFSSCTSLETVTINSKVDAIGKLAFKSCTNLTSIDLGPSTKSLRIIGVRAFEDAATLPSLDFSSATKLEAVGTYAFSGCTMLSAVSFPASLQSIATGAFSGCLRLYDVKLAGDTPCFIDDCVLGSERPSGATFYVDTSVRDAYLAAWTKRLDADYGDGAAEELIQSALPGTVPIGGAFYSIDEQGYVLEAVSSTFAGELQVVDGCHKIADGAVKGNTAITALSFAENNDDAVEFGDECFMGCTALEEINFNVNISGMGTSCFEGCTALTAFTTGGTDFTIEGFGDRCFANCTALYVPTLQCSIGYFGDECFLNCTTMYSFATTTTYQQSITSMGDRCFKGCTSVNGGVLTSKLSALTNIGEYAFEDCDTAGSVSVPANVTEIKEGTFMNCDNLKYVSVYGECTSYGDYAFKNCPNLLRTGGVAKAFAALTTIGEGAYDGCTNLTNNEKNWNLGKYTALASIGKNAFRNCSANLTDATFTSTALVSIGEGAFSGCSSVATAGFATATPPSIGEGAFTGCAFTGTEGSVTISAYTGDAAGDSAVYDAYLQALGAVIGDDAAAKVLVKPEGYTKTTATKQALAKKEVLSLTEEAGSAEQSSDETERVSTSESDSQDDTALSLTEGATQETSVPPNEGELSRDSATEGVNP